MAKQHHHDSFSQHTSQCSCSSDEHNATSPNQSTTQKLLVATLGNSNPFVPFKAQSYALQGDLGTGWRLYWPLFVDDYRGLLHFGPNCSAGGGHSVPAIHDAVTRRHQHFSNNQERDHGSVHISHVPAAVVHDSRTCQPCHTLNRELCQAVCNPRSHCSVSSTVVNAKVRQVTPALPRAPSVRAMFVWVALRWEFHHFVCLVHCRFGYVWGVCMFPVLAAKREDFLVQALVSRGCHVEFCLTSHQCFACEAYLRYVTKRSYVTRNYVTFCCFGTY